MSLSGPSSLLPGTSGLTGRASFTAPAPQPITNGASVLSAQNQTANLTPQLLGGPQFQGSMDANSQWKNQWQQAFNQYQATKDPNAARTVQLIRSGYSLDQIQSALQQNVAGNAATQQQNRGPLLQQMIAQQTASDPTIAGLKQSNALLGLQGGLQDQNFDLQRQQLQADTQNQLGKLGIALKGTADDKAYGAALVQSAEGQFKTDQAKAGTAFNGQMQDLYSTATANGAVTSGGTRDKTQNLKEQLFEANADAGVQKEREVARGTHMMAAADQQAQSLGMDRQSYVNSLNFGLQSIGLNKTLSAVDLMDKANSTNAQQAAAAQSIIQNLTGLAQQNPDLLKNWVSSQPNTSSSVSGGSRRY